MLQHFVLWVPLIWIPFLLIDNTGYFVLADPSSKIDPKLNALLEKGNRANVFVSFKNGIKSTLDKMAGARTGDRGTRNKALKDALQENADSSQASVVQMLSTRQSGGGFQYFKKFWSGNKLFIRDASAEVIRQVAENPEVVKIIKEPIYHIPKQIPGTQEEKQSKGIPVTGNPEDSAPLWALKTMQVFEAWEELGGKKGDGVIVGNIDDGVRHTHDTLRDSFIGASYGWYDPINKTVMPRWTDWHGTGTMGIIVGTKNIGVAPGARWMTCLGCDEYECPGEALYECLQWASCPTLPDGTQEDCSKAPHVINNSWVAARGADDFNEVILMMRAMGVIPVFSIGNVGDADYCGRTEAPGEKNFVIGVGAMNDLNWHHPGSAIGPASDGTIKPDIVAPGVLVVSAHPGTDDSYDKVTGTSFAAPHVTGLIALLKVRDPEMSYEQVFELITQNASRNITLHQFTLDRYCNESSAEVIPNNFFGYGVANALLAVKAQTLLLEKASGKR